MSSQVTHDSKSNDDLLYQCYLCSEKVDFSEIYTHPCVIGSENITIDDNRVFFDSNAEFCITVENRDPNTSHSSCLTPDVKSTESREERLIAEVHLREPLWNYTLPVQQRKKSIKDNLWQDVCDALDGYYTIEEDKKKWKNLHDTFKRCLATEKTGGKSGSAASNKKHKWHLFEQMKFLMDIDLGYNTQHVSNVPVNLAPPDNPPDSDDTIAELSDINEHHGSVSKKRKNESTLEKLVEALSVPLPKIEFPPAPVLPPLPSQPKEMDEINSFSRVVENKLRKMMERKASDTMLAIYKVLHEFEHKS